MQSIILEGKNGAGKSTLAIELQNRFSGIIKHAIRPANSQDAANLCLDQLDDIHSDDFFIFDRCHPISRLVYQQDSLQPLEAYYLTLFARHMAHNAILIYCTGNGDRDINKPHYDKQLIEETKDQEKIKDNYDKVMATLPYISYNFEKDDIECLLSHISSL